MSELGVALTVKRKNGMSVTDKEARALVKEMKAVVKRLKLTGSDGERLHGTDAHGRSEEDGSRIFIMTSSFIYKEMSEDIANDHYESDIAEGKKLIRELA